MVRYPLIAALASLVVIVTLGVAPAAAQYGPACYPPPVVSYYAPPPPQPIVTASFYAAPSYAAVQSYYRPFPILRPRLYVPGPAYYAPAYPYTAGYYAPGYFRY